MNHSASGSRVIKKKKKNKKKKAISWEMNGCLSNREMLNVTERDPAAQTMQAATGVPRS